jgi:RHS repeat-associated protein
VVENGVRETYSARYYNPSTGRFMSRDPEDGQAKDPASLHKYLYANGDPVNRIDPRGHGALVELSLQTWNAIKASLALEEELTLEREVFLCVARVLEMVIVLDDSVMDTIIDQCVEEL